MLRKMLILFLGIISIVTVYETNNQVYAQEKAKITICSFKNYFKGDNINLGEGEYIKTVTDSKFVVFYVENKDYNKASLEAMNLNNLEKNYGKGLFTEETGEDGIVEISNVDDGAYYIVELEKKEGGYIKKKNSAGILMIVDKNKDNIAYIKSDLFKKEDSISGGNDIKSGGEKEPIKKPNEIEGQGSTLSNHGSSKGELDKNLEKSSSKDEESEATLAASFENKIVSNSEKMNSIGQKSNDKIIKTGDVKIFYIVGFGVILMGLGSKIYKSSSQEQ